MAKIPFPSERSSHSELIASSASRVKRSAFFSILLFFTATAGAFGQSVFGSREGEAIITTPEKITEAQKNFVFAGTKWKSQNATFELRNDGTWYSSWRNGEFSKWTQVDKTTIRNQWQTWKLSEDATELVRIDGTNQIIAKYIGKITPDEEASAKPPPTEFGQRVATTEEAKAPTKENTETKKSTASEKFNEEFAKLKEEYEKTYAKAITSTNTADSSKLQSLRKIAVEQADTQLVSKIQEAQEAVAGGERIDIAEPDRKNRPSSGELNLYRIKTDRDRALDNAQKVAFRNFQSECDRIKRAALAAGEIKVAGEIEKFVLFANGTATPFLGKWVGFGNTLELKSDFTCLWAGRPEGTWRIIGKNKIEQTRLPRSLFFN